MRFSAWSLRVISVCSVFLVFAAPAWAHLSVSPTKVDKGALVDLTFGAPNEDDALGISHVTLTPPAGFDLDDAEAKPGWTQSRAGGSVTWTGGNIPQGQFATFTVRGTAPDRASTVVFNVAVSDRTGKSVTYRVGVDVGGGSHDYGKTALIVAIAGAALALLAFFTALAVWLRPPR